MTTQDLRVCLICGKIRQKAGFTRVGVGKKGQSYICTNPACERYDHRTTKVIK